MVPPGTTDCHAHVMRRGGMLIAERHSEPKRDVEVSEYLAVLDAHGVEHGVLTAPSFYGPDNTLLLAALAEAGVRLRGTVILDPALPPALDELDRQGVVGVRLNWLRRDPLPDVGKAGYDRLFAAAKERGWHVELFVEGRHMPTVLPHLMRSGARIVLDHFGCPDPEAGVASPGFRAVLDAIRGGNTWVKLSAPYRLGGADPRPYVDALMNAAGPHRLVWASDWPWLGHEDQFTYQDCLEWLSAWIPDADARRTVLSETPVELFHFGPDPR